MRAEKIKKHLYSLFCGFIDILLPNTCPVSHEIIGHGRGVSSDVWRGLFFISEPACKLCSVPFEYDIEGRDICLDCDANRPNYDRAVCAIKYDDASRPLVLKFKHNDHSELAVLFGKWMAVSGQEILDQSDYIIPVPLHPLRLLKRRYNQSSLLAKEVHRFCKANKTLSCDPPQILFDALLRNKNTKPQGQGGKGMRKQNVRGVFSVNQNKHKALNGKVITLIDDVLTSGATVNECAKILKNSGAKKVFVLTLARA